MKGITWRGTATAMSSIMHGGERRGTMTLLRREQIVLPDGRRATIPLLSGNTFRGRLRRIGEDLTRETLSYDGQISLSAAHALRGGGSLAKTGREPLSGSRLQALRNLVPQISVFGAAVGGTIIGGCIDVGKLIPHIVETNHITGANSIVTAFDATQLEAYTRQDDSVLADFSSLIPADTDTASPASSYGPMLFQVETFPAGTVFSTWLRLRWPTPLEVSFFLDVLSEFSAEGRIGGRVGIGHGEIRLALAASTQPRSDVDWKAFMSEQRQDVLTALESLT